MPKELRPVRRVVTGNDEHGKSKVVWDGPAPNAQPTSLGSRGHTDLWVWYDSPPLLSGDRDDGDLRYDFPGPATGGHLRVVQSEDHPTGYSPAADSEVISEHEPRSRPSRRVSDRGGGEPLWSREENELKLYFRHGDAILSAEIQSTPTLSAGPPKQVIEGTYDVGPPGHQHYDVSPDGRFIMMKEGARYRPERIRVIEHWNQIRLG